MNSSVRVYTFRGLSNKFLQKTIFIKNLIFTYRVVPIGEMQMYKNRYVNYEGESIHFGVGRFNFRTKLYIGSKTHFSFCKDAAWNRDK